MPVNQFHITAVCPLVQRLADSFHESCSVPDNIAFAYNHQAPYVSNVSLLKAARQFQIQFH